MKPIIPGRAPGPKGSNYGCDWCGRILGEHKEGCPQRVWAQQTEVPTSALRPMPMAEGTVRGSDSVVICREMMADQGVGWEAIPDGDRIAMTQAVISLCFAAERAGWKFRRPSGPTLIRLAPFIVASVYQAHYIARRAPDYRRLPAYHQRMLPHVVNPMLSAMCRLGWDVTGPLERKPEHSGGKYLR